VRPRPGAARCRPAAAPAVAGRGTGVGGSAAFTPAARRPSTATRSASNRPSRSAAAIPASDASAPVVRCSSSTPINSRVPGASPSSRRAVVGAFEAARSSADVLDEPVGAFGLGVGDPGAAERLDLWATSSQRSELAG
jgi:hypothetical protein